MKLCSILLMSLSLVACGVETKPNPNFDAGGSGGSGATSGTGGTAGTAGSGGTSGTGGVGGDMDAGEDSGFDAGFDSSMDAGDANSPPCTVICEGSTPHCNETSMTCVECLTSDHCIGNSKGAVCDDGECVECTAVAGCTLPQVCADDGNACVACNDSDQCSDGVCLTGGHDCVECNDETDCDNGEQCSPQKTCVQCLNDSQCNAADAAKCNVTNNTCVPCTDNSQCEGITNGPTTLGVCDTGTCVECTATDYDQCGNGNLGQPRVCNVITNRCGEANQTEGSAGLCQSCVASAQCDEGQVCVEQEFEDHAVGTFCFWRISAAQGPNGSCSSVPPYSRGVTNEQAVEGDSVNICSLRNTTCPGINHFSNPAIACAPGGTPNHDLCGFSYSGEGTAGNARDAYCEQIPNDTAYRCTVPCLSTDDCVDGSTCNTSATPRTCGL